MQSKSLRFETFELFRFFFFYICEEIGNECMFSASFTKTKGGRAIQPHPSTKKPDSYPDAALEFDH